MPRAKRARTRTLAPAAASTTVPGISGTLRSVKLYYPSTLWFQVYLIRAYVRLPCAITQLAKPVFHIGFLGVVHNLLRCVCINCSRVLVDRVRACGVAVLLPY